MRLLPLGEVPNIAAAYKQLTQMGFAQVKVLYLASNFGADGKILAIRGGDFPPDALDKEIAAALKKPS